jgi:hypothetical protein
MATKSEKHRAEELHDATVKNAKAKPARRKLAQKKRAKTSRTTGTQGSKRAEKKATFALELAVGGARPSRKSTRASAHHVRSDTNLNLREERKVRSPDSRFRRAKAKATRVRGKR